jgi:hypothetical protein
MVLDVAGHRYFSRVARLAAPNALLKHIVGSTKKRRPGTTGGATKRQSPDAICYRKRCTARAACAPFSESTLDSSNEKRELLKTWAIVAPIVSLVFDGHHDEEEGGIPFVAHRTLYEMAGRGAGAEDDDGCPPNCCCRACSSSLPPPPSAPSCSF